MEPHVGFGNTVELENVTKTFGPVRAVDSLSLYVPPGSVYGFIGPNGSGKTTTLRIILNILKADTGQVRLFGEPIRSPRDSRIGYLPEERGLYRRMKVREHLCFLGDLKTGRSCRHEVDAWLEKLGLIDWAEKRIETLSKGMSQKVQFIAAVLGRPRLLVLDEPFSGLDPVNLDVLRRAVLELQRDGATVLFSTHDMSIAEQMCDFICMIFQGRKVLDGTLASIQDKYGADTVRVRVENGAAALRGLAGVAHVEDLGQAQILRLTPEGDPRQVLAALVARGGVRLFEITRPSLHDIFVRIAGPGVKEGEKEYA